MHLSHSNFPSSTSSASTSDSTSFVERKVVAGGDLAQREKRIARARFTAALGNMNERLDGCGKAFKGTIGLHVVPPLHNGHRLAENSARYRVV